MKVALVGRALCGFGSAEVINRQLISSCVSVQGMTRASALFVTASAIGMGIGPLIAGEVVKVFNRLCSFILRYKTLFYVFSYS